MHGVKLPKSDVHVTKKMKGNNLKLDEIYYNKNNKLDICENYESLNIQIHINIETNYSQNQFLRAAYNYPTFKYRKNIDPMRNYLPG